MSFWCGVIFFVELLVAEVKIPKSCLFVFGSGGYFLVFFSIVIFSLSNVEMQTWSDIDPMEIRGVVIDGKACAFCDRLPIFIGCVAVGVMCYPFGNWTWML